MRYWDEDRPEWDGARRDYAAAWRNQPKWTVSRSSPSMGPNAALVGTDLETAMGNLKTRHDGEFQVSGPELAGALTDLNLIDEYRIYLHPVVRGGCKPFFAAARPPLRLIASEHIGDTVIRLSYVPAWPTRSLSPLPERTSFGHHPDAAGNGTWGQ